MVRGLQTVEEKVLLNEETFNIIPDYVKMNDSAFRIFKNVYKYDNYWIHMITE